MEYTKIAVVQLLLLGSALAQQPFGQQPLRQPHNFQQAGFQPSAGFPQQQLQQQQQRFQQQPAFRAQQQQPEQFSTFGEGVESFKQINNRPVEGAAQQPAQQQARTQQFAARPVAPAFQQQPLRAAPVAAPAAFQAAPAPTAAPAPVELPHALGAPAEQHDAQVFVRRPQPGAAVQVIPTQQAEAVRVQQENERLQAETLRIQQENARIRAENQRIQQDNLRFRQESQQQQQQLQQAQQAQQAQQQQAQQQLTELINQQDVPQQEVLRVQAAPAPVQAAPVHHQPTRSRGLARRPVAAVEAAPKPVAAPVRVAPVRVAEAAVANPAEEELFEEQAKNAQYTFASSVDDKLTDNSQIRQETRDGLNLAGLYSYSDGFFRRTVHYEADENGYRVVKEEVEPIGNGPQLNPNGAAEVQAQISGQNFGYRITADDIKERKETERVPVQQQQQRGFRGLEQDFSQ